MAKETCNRCGKTFKQERHLQQHIRDKHHGKGAKSAPIAAFSNDDDESFASRAIQAELDHAMGVENADYDWLVEPYK
jgi:hypothetical protein